MTQSKLTDLVYWGSHVGRHAPGLFSKSVRLTVASRLSTAVPKATLLVGTHHKVLTVFMGRLLRGFSVASKRRFSRGKADAIDYSCDVIQDDHSLFDFEKLDRPYYGLHVRRDPRDLLISSTFYHQHASEKWLHLPREEFSGKTYAEHLHSLPTLEDKLLFELDHSAGRNIRDMLSWDYNQTSFSELKYDELIGPNGSDFFASAIKNWPLSVLERDVMIGLFDYFSISGPGVRGNKHVRNPTSGQWKKHFSAGVQERFDELFPTAVRQLGYEQ